MKRYLEDREDAESRWLSEQMARGHPSAVYSEIQMALAHLLSTTGGGECRGHAAVRTDATWWCSFDCDGPMNSTHQPQRIQLCRMPAAAVDVCRCRWCGA